MMGFCRYGRVSVALAALVFVTVCAPKQYGETSTTPASAADELLRADRAFAANARQTDVVSALAAMFSADVIMPVPGNRFAEGRDAALESLRSNADNARSRIDWVPIRAGISADGQHGFTFGYMTLRRPDGSAVPLKYMAYWIRQADGWKVAAYKRRAAPRAPEQHTVMAAAVPPRMTRATSDAALIERHRVSLQEAESSFSRDAQSIGLGAAFARYGRFDAVNMGGPNDAGFVVGAENIARSVGAGAPQNSSPVSWSADRAIVASSGDLGITFGMIRSNSVSDAATAVPFFTIWWRDDPTQPWRYIAE